MYLKYSKVLKLTFWEMKIVSISKYAYRAKEKKFEKKQNNFLPN